MAVAEVPRDAVRVLTVEEFYKIAVATPALHLGDPDANAGEHLRMAEVAAEKGAAVIAFPELSLTGYTCGDLFFRSDLVSEAATALTDFAHRTKDLPLVSIVGFPERWGDGLYNSAAVVAGGEVVGIVRKKTLANYSEYYEKRQFDPAPDGELPTVFEVNGLRFGVEICEDMWAPVPPSSLMAGADVVFNLSASTDFLGKAQVRNLMIVQQSVRLGCAYALAAAGIGESTADAVYGGGSIIVDDGHVAAEAPLFMDSALLTADIDIDALRYRRHSGSSVRRGNDVRNVAISRSVPGCKPSYVDPSPFMTTYGEAGWVEKMLTIQAVALARRMAAASARKLVIGVSGGADSALALVAAKRAAVLCDGAVIAVVMPGPASSVQSQRRAVALAKALGAETRVIDIREVCRQHLEDIGHGQSTHDIVFENVQARERTQVLMDLANQEGALVVGTGDLSEIALGWNTYNGDHMSMYQVNASVPKTMVLAALKEIASQSPEPVGALLREIAEAPITPELVPGAAAGDSEDRLGPYELHDFFLYHFLANGASLAKLSHLAGIAFRGRYDEMTIGRTLATFGRRFPAAQYKRNCVPDGPKITLSLSPRADWRMPSDSEFLKTLQAAEDGRS